MFDILIKIITEIFPTYFYSRLNEELFAIIETNVTITEVLLSFFIFTFHIYLSLKIKFGSNASAPEEFFLLFSSTCGLQQNSKLAFRISDLLVHIYFNAVLQLWLSYRSVYVCVHKCMSFQGGVQCLHLLFIFVSEGRDTGLSLNQQKRVGKINVECY